MRTGDLCLYLRKIILWSETTMLWSVLIRDFYIQHRKPKGLMNDLHDASNIISKITSKGPLLLSMDKVNLWEFTKWMLKGHADNLS